MFEENKVKFKIVIPNVLNSKQLFGYLSDLCFRYSGIFFKKLIILGSCKINGNYFFLEKKISRNDTFDFFIKNKNFFIFGKYDFKYNVIYNDYQLIIINKFYNSIIYPGKQLISFTLIGNLIIKFVCLLNVPRFGVVHRLDKDTSGIFIITQNIFSYKIMLLNMKLKNIIKIYKAIVWGKLLNSNFIIEYMEKSKNNFFRMCVSNSGKLSVSKYSVLNLFDYNTYIKIYLYTGKMHQIRVHMFHINNFIVGEKIYKNNYFYKKIFFKKKYFKYLQIFFRNALHSCILFFFHPINKRLLTFEVFIQYDMNNLLYYIKNREKFYFS